MSSKIGTALSYMALVFLRILEVTAIETRVRAMEELSSDSCRRYSERQNLALEQREPTPEELDEFIEAEFSSSPPERPHGES
jgi:hypothetical protein